MGLDETVSCVLEDVGTVEVCVSVKSPIKDCPVDYPFNVSLSTSDGSAGTQCMHTMIFCVVVIPVAA